MKTCIDNAIENYENIDIQTDIFEKVINTETEDCEYNIDDETSNIGKNRYLDCRVWKNPEIGIKDF